MISYTRASSGDEDVLWEMLVYAAALPEPVPEAKVRAQADDSLRSYVVGFGRAGDFGLIARSPTGAVGAAWLRLSSSERVRFKVATPSEPELAIGVQPGQRGRGIGSELLRQLVRDTADTFPALRLSVRTTNPSLRLYQRFGFEVIEQIQNRVGGDSVVMRRPGR